MAETAVFVQAVGRVAPITSNHRSSLYQENEIVADWLRVLKWCLIPILIFTVYWALEKYGLKLSSRLVSNPAEFPCRFFGYSHYFVGLVFMLSSRRMRFVGSWLWLIGLLAASGGICYFFARFGGDRNPVMVIAYFLFFMVHGFRDLVFFYHRSDDNPAIEKVRSWILILIQACLIISLFYFLAPAYLIYLKFRPKTYTPDLLEQVNALRPFLNFALQWGWVLLLAALICLWHLTEKLPGGRKSVWAMDRAVLLVLIYASLIILASPLVGRWTYNLLILSHFVGWYSYASRRFATLPKQISRTEGLWKWFRGSVSGFQWLHLGAAAVFLVLIVINNFALSRTGILETLLSAKAFYYWTVVHVTISFAPKS